MSIPTWPWGPHDLLALTCGALTLYTIVYYSLPRDWIVRIGLSTRFILQSCRRAQPSGGGGGGGGGTERQSHRDRKREMPTCTGPTHWCQEDTAAGDPSSERLEQAKEARRRAGSSAVLCRCLASREIGMAQVVKSTYLPTFRVQHTQHDTIRSGTQTGTP